jgi:hypothetical protein
MTKYLIGGLRQRTYYASVPEWTALAEELEKAGETRLAEAIRADIAKRGYWYKGFDQIPLRFRGGSVAKLDSYAE